MPEDLGEWTAALLLAAAIYVVMFSAMALF